MAPIRGGHGGSVYVVRIAGQRRHARGFVAPSHDTNLRTREEIEDVDPTSLPPWVRYQINMQRHNEADEIIEA